MTFSLDCSLRTLLAAALAVSLAACTPPAADGGAQASAMTVQVATLEKRQWPEMIQASGPLVAWQQVVVSPETGGLRLAELRVEVGQTVRAGQVMALLADASVRADVDKQQAMLAQAQANLRQARWDVQRMQAVENSGGLSAQQVEQYRVNEAVAQGTVAAAQADLDSARLRLRQTRIVAPDDGVISARAGVLGDVVASGAEIYRLLRQGRIEWHPELDPRQFARVQEGQAVQLRLPDGSSVEGSVRLVEPTLDAGSGRGKVYVRLPADSAARVGMFASGQIVLPKREVMTLPEAAVVLRDGRAYAWVVAADNTVSSRLIVVGSRQQERVEVVSGIDGTVSVVASGGAFLSEGVSVTVSADGGSTTDARMMEPSA